MSGTSVPETIVELSKKKVITAFVDGDRGGGLIVKELMATADIDYVTKAPDGKEVEELTKKEIHKALRSRVAAEQIRMEISKGEEEHHRPEPQPQRKPYYEKPLTPQERDVFRDISEDLIGTRGAYLLDEKLNILGKVPVSELQGTLRSINNAYAVVFDGSIEREMVRAAERANVKHLIAMNNRVRPQETRIKLATINEL
jgi:DNA primase